MSATSSPNDGLAASGSSAPGTVPATTNNTTNEASNSQHLNRACEACRFHKVRCLPEPSAPGKCQRCAKTNRECIFAAPQRRRPRRRAEARMAELEKEVRAMRALLKDNGGGQGSGDDDENDSDDHNSPNRRGPHIPGPGVEPPPQFTAKVVRGRGDGSGLPPDLNKIPGIIPADGKGTSIFSPDVIERGVLGMHLAHDLVEAYRTVYTENCPTIILPPDSTAQTLRENQPVLFLAIIAASSLRIDPDLAHTLKDELHRAFAELVFIRCEKTRELVQAFVVTVCFYNPPDAVRNIQVFQYAHMAAAMAMDIGLGYRPTTAKSISKDPRELEKALKDESLLLDARIILSCWLMPARVATKARRPSFLPFTNWMQESMVILDNSPNVHDRRLVAWVKLQKIATEATTSFGFDDASTSIILTPLRLQVIVRAFEKRMEEWRTEYAPLLNVNLLMEYHSNRTSIYEFAMDGGKHEADEFRKRHFSLPTLGDGTAEVQPHMPLSPLEVDATVKCITSSHDTLDTFLNLDTLAIQNAPNAYFVLATYSLAVLLRLNISFALGSNDLADLVDTQSIKFDYYIEALHRTYNEAIGPRKLWIPVHWNHVLGKIKQWYEKNKPRLSKHRGLPNTQAPNRNNQSQPDSMNAEPSTTISNTPSADTGLTMSGFTPMNNSFSPQSNTGSSPENNPNYYGNQLFNPNTWLDPMDMGNGETFLVDDFAMGFTGWAPPADPNGFPQPTWPMGGANQNR